VYAELVYLGLGNDSMDVEIVENLSLIAYLRFCGRRWACWELGGCHLDGDGLVAILEKEHP
jgi:hypothetical protein